MSFNLLDQSNHWLLQLNAKQTRAKVKFYNDWLEQGVDINADYIHFVSQRQEVEQNEETEIVAPDTTASPIDELHNKEVFANMPPIKVNCASCKFGRADFGYLVFDIRRKDDQTLALDNLVATRGNNRLSLNGNWQFDGEKSTTSLEGNLQIKDLEQELALFDYQSLVKESGLNTTFDASWPGAPYDYSTGRLAAKINVKLDDGYLDEVSDKGARIFSVLSLQSLVRKLSLDFRDMFSDGMFYTKIEGDFTVNKGVLYTDNSMLYGPAGDLSIKGNTNLTSAILDYRLSYKPNLTSSLPVLAWIATLNPVTFLAGIAIDEVITSQVVSELTFELTGNVTDPQIKEVDRKTQDITVGRSTPPQVVENSIEEQQDETQNDGEQEPQLDQFDN